MGHIKHVARGTAGALSRMASSGVSRAFITRSFKGRNIEQLEEKAVESPRMQVSPRQSMELYGSSVKSVMARTFSTFSRSFLRAPAESTASNSAKDATKDEEKKEDSASQSGEGAAEGKAEAKEATEEGQKGEGEAAEGEDKSAVKIKELEEEVGLLKDHYLRAMAEVENTRRRAALDIESARKYALTSFAKDLLDVPDNLGRALESVKIPEEGEVDPQLKSLYEGVTLTNRVMHNVMQKHGVVKMEPLGQKFDPNRHNALMQLDPSAAPDKEPGCVAFVAKEGYMINDRVLRAADVGVVREK